MNSTDTLFRQMRRFLADQERALRAAALAESSRSATPELRALYTRHVDPPEDAAPARADDRPISVSTGVPLQAS